MRKYALDFLVLYYRVFFYAAVLSGDQRDFWEHALVIAVQDRVYRFAMLTHVGKDTALGAYIINPFGF
jgi:hypothetical protein